MARRFDRKPHEQNTSAGRSSINSLRFARRRPRSPSTRVGDALPQQRGPSCQRTSIARLSSSRLSSSTCSPAFARAINGPDVVLFLCFNLGVTRPASAQRRPERRERSAESPSPQAFGARIDRRTSVRAPAPGSRRVVSRLRDCSAFTKDFACPARHRGHPDGDRLRPPSPSRLRSSNGISTTSNLYTANRAIGVLFAPAGRSRGPSVPQSERWSSVMLGFRGAFFDERRFWRGRTDSPGPCAGEADFRRLGLTWPTST